MQEKSPEDDVESTSLQDGAGSRGRPLAWWLTTGVGFVVGVIAIVVMTVQVDAFQDDLRDGNIRSLADARFAQILMIIGVAGVLGVIAVATEKLRSRFKG